jgi:predicted RNA methylase
MDTVGLLCAGLTLAVAYPSAARVLSLDLDVRHVNALGDELFAG